MSDKTQSNGHLNLPDHRRLDDSTTSEVNFAGGHDRPAPQANTLDHIEPPDHLSAELPRSSCASSVYSKTSLELSSPEDTPSKDDFTANHAKSLAAEPERARLSGIRARKVEDMAHKAYGLSRSTFFNTFIPPPTDDSTMSLPKRNPFGRLKDANAPGKRKLTKAQISKRFVSLLLFH